MEKGLADNQIRGCAGFVDALIWLFAAFALLKLRRPVVDLNTITLKSTDQQPYPENPLPNHSGSACILPHQNHQDR
ncbi:MAG TPA: hypothetical protein PKE06_02265 [Flavilitoribacter sp.]|nr:hypothetical protein [Flavilitoribacter sp.]HMQ87214.1 hypothetical protein [Flavilitoribacter sp.]